MPGYLEKSLLTGLSYKERVDACELNNGGEDSLARILHEFILQATNKKSWKFKLPPTLENVKVALYFGRDLSGFTALADLSGYDQLYKNQFLSNDCKLAMGKYRSMVSPDMALALRQVALNRNLGRFI